MQYAGQIRFAVDMQQSETGGIITVNASVSNSRKMSQQRFSIFSEPVWETAGSSGQAVEKGQQVLIQSDRHGGHAQRGHTKWEKTRTILRTLG